MSLNSLTTNRVARDLGRKNKALAVASEDAVGPKEQDVQNALSALVEYMPAETVALYLAVMSSLPALAESIPKQTTAYIYGLFAVLTPVLFALIYCGKRRAAGQPRWPGLESWPWWPMIAATIAFLAWGLAVPDAPFFSGEKGRVLGGLLAIVVSVLLGVLGRFFAPAAEQKPATA